MAALAIRLTVNDHLDARAEAWRSRYMDAMFYGGRYYAEFVRDPFGVRSSSPSPSWSPSQSL